MKGAWIEWDGCGDIPNGKVDVMFRDSVVIEASESRWWVWRWHTGDHEAEIVGYRKVGDKSPKVERNRPEFTFEDGMFLGQLNWPYARDVILIMEQPSVFTIQQKISAVRKYLKATTWQSEYSFKPLRKKLKLYVKWLQSEMSKKESSGKRDV